MNLDAILNDIYNPFLTFEDLTCDESVNRQSVERMGQRNGLILDYLTGKAFADEILDCVEEHGIGADNYLSSVSTGVVNLYEAGGRYYKDHNGIIVPA